MVEIAETIEALEALAPLWKRLERGGVSVFGCYAWCRAAWEDVLAKERGNRLWVVKAETGGETVICPFYIDRSGTLRFIMDVHSDLCDTVYCGPGNRHLCYAEVAELIVRTHSIRRVVLRKLDAAGEAARYFSAFLPRTLVYRDCLYSWLLVNQTEDFVGEQRHLKSKDRSRLRGLLHKGREYELRILSAVAGDDFPEEMLRRLRTDMVLAGYRDRHFLDDSLMTFAKRIYAVGLCEVAELSQGGVPVAAAFRLVQGGRISCWVVLYSAPILTSVLYVLYCEAKAHLGPWIMSLGVGAYGYKIGTFRPEMGVSLALRSEKSFFGWTISCASVVLRALKHVLTEKRRR